MAKFGDPGFVVCSTSPGKFYTIKTPSGDHLAGKLWEMGVGAQAEVLPLPPSSCVTSGYLFIYLIFLEYS